MIEYQDDIDDLIDNFDFDKVETVMQALDWKWSNGDKTLSVPTIPRMRKTARNILREAAKMAIQTKQGYSVATGGFFAHVYEPKEGETKLYMRIHFEIESNDNYE